MDSKPVDSEAQQADSETKLKTNETDPEIKENEPTDLETKIISQVEYYFGDHNLVKDKFMKEKIKENDGWISLAILLTFNRLKALSTEEEEIVKALKKSSNDLLEISEDNTKIRRKPEKALPDKQDNWREGEAEKTVYVKGFPVDATMDMLLDFFKSEGKIINIFMKKKYHSRSFKGSVFATFETKEEAEAFAQKENQKYKNTVLIKEMRKDYQTRKQSEFTKRREEREKRKLEKQQKGDQEGEEPAFNPDEDMKKNCLMKLTGFAKGTSREDIKETLCPHGNIAYVDFNIGCTEAVIRFEESGVAQDVYEKARTGEEGEKKLMIKNAEITATFPEGDEEIEYWKKIISARSNYIREKKNHKRRGGPYGGRGRGGKSFRGGRGRGRGRGRGDNESENKERNGDSPVSDRKRSATVSAEGPPAKQEKPEVD